MRSPWRRGLADLGGLSAVAAVITALGRGQLAAPPLRSWSALARWYEAVGPDVAVAAGLRGLALALTGWLLIATVLQLLAAASTLAPLRSLADLISPRSLQRLGHSLAGLSLTAGLAASAPSAGTPAGVVSSATAAGWSAPVLPTDADPVADEPGGGTAVLRLLPDTTDTTAVSGTVTVEPGDSLWSIAADELEAVRGSRPTDREVATYWRRVIEVNRPSLVDPANPDLIFPGQVMTLPTA